MSRRGLYALYAVAFVTAAVFEPRALLAFICICIVIAGLWFFFAVWSADFIDSHVQRALTDDRYAVERAYRAGGWDETPLYDQRALEAVDLALYELARDLDTFEDGTR